MWRWLKSQTISALTWDSRAKRPTFKLCLEVSDPKQTTIWQKSGPTRSDQPPPPFRRPNRTASLPGSCRRKLHPSGVPERRRRRRRRKRATQTGTPERRGGRGGLAELKGGLRLVWLFHPFVVVQPGVFSSQKEDRRNLAPVGPCKEVHKRATLRLKKMP